MCITVASGHREDVLEKLHEAGTEWQEQAVQHLCTSILLAACAMATVPDAAYAGAHA